ncbi:MAG: hypothetical protein IKN15_02690 [Bacteroidaceae bacterium]|nr:hypothetical protein [Bacteroidaceae bacterium]
MAAKTQITNKGLELMASSSKATGQHWWIGWYALAFVPDELQENEDEQLKPGMTKLTKDGDIIYNIFQGDMNGDGYQTTKASNKFKSVNYDSNIKKNYRYVLDEDGRNNLVTWVDGKYGLKGAYIYQGVKVNASRDDDTIDYAKSLIPLPAPLLYTGVKAAGEGWSESGMDIFLGSGNDRIENFYPVDEVGEDVVPRVSTDFRNYEGYKNGLPKIEGGDAEDYAHALGETFNDVDVDGWFPSVSTYTQNEETDMGEDYNQYCYQYWKILSISNFNKYCAPVNASGLLYDENTGCRNMAKATKYFPISDYSVTSTAKTADNEYATGIKLTVQLKLNGNAEDGAYFKEVETGDDDNVATLNPSPTDEQHALFNSQKVSFKFNRIGIYAVPMRQYGCSGDSGEMKAQYQIDTEAEPVLFAVCEWDSPVTLSDSGDGLSEFQSDIFIDLSAAVEDSSVIRESAVFYNLYEDDAIDWYKNQLVANASMAEALVNMQIEMGYLLNQKNAKAGCCPKQEAIQQKEKYVTGLRNLVDARDYNSNSVRNRLATEENTAIKYKTAVGAIAPYISNTLDGNITLENGVYSRGMDEFSPSSTLPCSTYLVPRFLYYQLPSDIAQAANGTDYNHDAAEWLDYESTETTSSGTKFDDAVYFTKEITYKYRDDSNSHYEIYTWTGTDWSAVRSGGVDPLPSSGWVVATVTTVITYKNSDESYYTESTTTKQYKLPMFLFYDNSTVASMVLPSGWSVPTMEQWKDIIANMSDSVISSLHLPMAGYFTNEGGYIPRSDVTYFAIKDDASHFVKFNGNRFEIVGNTISVTHSSAAGGSYVVEETISKTSVLPVYKAINYCDVNIDNYKLGSDSYALMQESATLGSHSFNAGYKSIISPNASNCAILASVYSVIGDSDDEYDSCVIMGGEGNAIHSGSGRSHSLFGSYNAIYNQSEGGQHIHVWGDFDTINSGLYKGINIFGSENAIYSINIAEDIMLVGSRNSIYSGAAYKGINIFGSENAIYSTDSTKDMMIVGSQNSIYYGSQLADSLLIGSGNTLHNTANVTNSLMLGSNLTAHDTANVADSVVLGATVRIDNQSNVTNSLMLGSNLTAQYTGILTSSIMFGSNLTAQYTGIVTNSVMFGRNLSVKSAGSVSDSILYGDELSVYNGSEANKSIMIGHNMSVLNAAVLEYSSLYGSASYVQNGTRLTNVHALGTVSFSGADQSLSNCLILAKHKTAYESDVGTFTAYIAEHNKGYPMIVSEGGIALYENKMWLGDTGLAAQFKKAPALGDVLTVVAVEGNLATVAWMPGGENGKFGTIHLELVYKYQNDDGSRGCPSVYAVNPWRSLNGNVNVIYVNDHEVTNSSTAVNTMNSYLTGDIKFTVSNGDLVLENTSASDSYMISGTARCEIVERSINEPSGDGSSYGWQMWDTKVFIPQPLGTYAAAMDTISSVGPSGQYNDLVRSLAFGYKTSETAQGDINGALCSMEVGELPQTLVCKWVVDITYRKV